MLAYLRSGTGVGPVVVIADPSGSDLRVLPGFYAWTMPAWSPDGRGVIVFDDRPGPADEPGRSVVALDVRAMEPLIELEAPTGVIPSDNAAGSWQRVAP